MACIHSTTGIDTAAIKYEGFYWPMGAKSVKNWTKSSQNGRFWAILEFFLLNYVHPCNFILVQKCYLIWSNPSLFSVFRGTSTDKCGTGRGKPRATRPASHDQFHTSPRAVPRKKVKKKKGKGKSQTAPQSHFFPRIESSFMCQKMSPLALTVGEKSQVLQFFSDFRHFGRFSAV